MSEDFNLYATETNAVTGEVTIIPYTPEQIAAVLEERRKAQVPESITRRQCAMQMFSSGLISGEEAVTMAQSGIPPAAVLVYINTLTEPQRTMALIDFAAMNYYRANLLLAALMAANGMTEIQVDDFFTAASKL